MKGKTTEGKWFVRPIGWVGEWNEKGELISNARTVLNSIWLIFSVMSIL